MLNPFQITGVVYILLGLLLSFGPFNNTIKIAWGFYSAGLYEKLFQLIFSIGTPLFVLPPLLLIVIGLGILKQKRIMLYISLPIVFLLWIWILLMLSASDIVYSILPFDFLYIFPLFDLFLPIPLLLLSLWSIRYRSKLNQNTKY